MAGVYGREVLADGPMATRRDRRYRLTGPLADHRWRIGVVQVLTRELPQGMEELTLEYLARRYPASPEDIWYDPDEPMVEISIEGRTHDPRSTSFSHGDNTLEVEGAWRFHLRAEEVQG